MKQHAIIPIFISHRGCPNDCVFCNQRAITAKQGDVTVDDVKNTIETWLTTLKNRSIKTIEVAFFGGSFTGIPLEEQQAFLNVAKEYKQRGKIQKIHLSTRPDYIDESILNHLKSYTVDVIELGVQSLDDEVLRLSGRGHDSKIVYRSSQLIQDFGFTLGIQLMIGLPGDTLQKDIYSAKETVKIGPQIARLYPTVVIKDTNLYTQYQSGTYLPLTEKDAVMRTKAMYQILDQAGIRIIRVGLKSSDLISTQQNPNGQIAANTFHPAFRQLVEGEIAREAIEAQIHDLFPGLDKDPTQNPAPCPSVLFISNEKSWNQLFGHKGCNRNYFANKYPSLNIRYVKDTDAGFNLKDHQYLVLDQSEK